MLSKYTISPAQVQSVHHIFCPCYNISAHVNLEYHFCQCPVGIIPPLLPLFSEYTIYPAQFNKYITLLSISHYFLPMFTPNTTPQANVNSEYHLYYLSSVSTPHLRPNSSQYITSHVHVTSSSGHVHSEYHPSCQCEILTTIVCAVLLQLISE